MLLAMDIGDWISLLFVAGVIVVSLVMRSKQQQAQSRPTLRRTTRNPAPPTRQWCPAPAGTPLTQDVDSNEAVAVAKELAPEYMEVANAPRLSEMEGAAVAEAPAEVLNLRDLTELRRALIMQEILGKPRALRRRS